MTASQRVQDSIEIILRRFAGLQNLEGAFGRRAVIERAKGILMERHDTTEEHAFRMLRAHARSGNRKLIDVAGAVVDVRGLLPGPERDHPLRRPGSHGVPRVSCQ
jgi:AmiR/NasT family two-component response regulator